MGNRITKASSLVFIIIVIGVFLGACQATPPSPTSTPEPTYTTAPPTATLEPTATTIPSATPYAQLPANGPYFLYRTSSISSVRTILHMMDVEDFGRKEIIIPNRGEIWQNLDKAISPDGQWLAFLTPTFPSSIHFDLNLLNLQSEEQLFITPLLSEDFPENQKIVANTMINLGVQEEARHFIEIGLTVNLRAIRWSPDGRYLAFAAQIDGPSTDIYLYELATGEVERLTDDLFNLETLDWSPDSQWIMFENLFPGVNYSGSTLEAINVKTKEQKKFGPSHYLFWQGRGWISNTEFLITSTPEGNDPSNLRIANVETGKLTPVWEETYFTFAVDRENKIIEIFGVPDKEKLEAGFFLVSYSGDRTSLINGSGAWIHYFRGGEETRFVGRFTEGVFGFALDESSQLITQANQSLYISPDLRWMVVGTEFGFEVYDKNDQLIHTSTEITLPEEYFKQLVWRPDGEGFFVRIDEILYYVSIPNGELVFVEDCRDGDCWKLSSGNYAWLP